MNNELEKNAKHNAEGSAGRCFVSGGNEQVQ